MSKYTGPSHPERRTLDDHVLYEVENKKRNGMELSPNVHINKHFYLAQTRYTSIRTLRQRIRKRFLARFKWFFLFSILISLLLYSRGGNNQQILLGSTPSQWVMFIFVVLVVEQCTTVVDHLLFFAFESLWRGRYSTIYYLHSLHGPLGHFMSLVIIVNIFDTMAVPQAIPNYRKVITIAMGVLTLYTLKSYWERKHFVGLLELRFRDKLRIIDTCQRILSLLARPILATSITRSPVPPYDPPAPAGVGGGFLWKGSLSPISEHEATAACPMHSSPFSSSSSPWPCAGLWSWCMCCIGHPSAYISEEDEASEEGGRAQTGRVHDKFWERVDCVRCGALVVSMDDSHGEDGVGGQVRIQSVSDASAFGRNLFKHLMRNTVSQRCVDVSARDSQQGLPAYLITELLRERCCSKSRPDAQGATDESEFSDMLEVCLQAGQLFGFSPEIPTKAFSVAVQSEHCKGLGYPYLPPSDQMPSGHQVVTEEQMVAGVCSAYRSLKSASASLVNLQDLHRSVTDIADNIFWGGIVLLLQMVFGVKTLATLTPLLTIVFGLSFALGPSVGSLCLSVVYVMFLLPYDVGNRVCITDSSGSREGGIVGNVSSITLGYTTIITTLNEKLRFPNHVLFNRAVVNMHESDNAVVEVFVDLPLYMICSMSTLQTPPSTYDSCIHSDGKGISVGAEDSLAEFWRRVGVAIREQRVDEWLEMAVYCREIRHEVNNVRYLVRLTHRAGWHEAKRINRSKSDVVDLMQRLQREMHLLPVRAVQPVTILPQEGYGR